MTNKIDWNNPDLDEIDWDNPDIDLDEILWKWFKDIDKEEWFIITNNKKNVDKITNFDIEYLENKLNIYINISKYNIVIYDKESDYLIWSISKWIYSHNWIESSNHLYKKVDENYRLKWFWTILFNLYKNNFNLPKTEMSHIYSSIRFLSKNWYKLSSKIINWEKIEISNEEIDELLYWEYKLDDLSSTYELILE